MPGADDYSNPMAPPEDAMHLSGKQNALRNEDFRRLLATPRVGAAPHTDRRSSHEGQHSFTHRATAPAAEQGDKAKGPRPKKGGGGGAQGGNNKFKKKSTSATAGAAAKKKDGEDDSLNDILKNYRDRAAERRDGETKPVSLPTEADLLQLTAAYRAVPGDGRAILDAAERRKQAIHESKYLGGDMEHTHLVKGLDYSLLQKVRSEIDNKEQEEERLEAVYQSAKEEREETEANMKTPLARNIYRLLFKEEASKTNELFAPRRMAYVIELDDEYAEADIPTTLLRSKQDCPVDDTTANLSTNDMVIQKLTQVLSYLRADTKRKKKDKPDAEPEETLKQANRDIFDDAGDYVPNVKHDNGSKKEKPKESYFDKPDTSSSNSRKDRDRAHDRDRRRDEPDRPRERDSRRDRRAADRRGRERSSRTDATDSRLAQGFSPADLALKRQTEAQGLPSEDGKTRSGEQSSTTKRSEEQAAKAGSAHARSKGDIQLTATDSYAECYPGGVEMFEAAGESDDEADYTRMDLGSKKGPVKRWDFETSEEYEDYMNQREALPKAAYQYGVKMNDGRKTRKTGPGAAERDNKQKIDKQWNQISRILEKRKDGGVAEEVAKKIKY